MKPINLLFAVIGLCLVLLGVSLMLLQKARGADFNTPLPPRHHVVKKSSSFVIGKTALPKLKEMRR